MQTTQSFVQPKLLNVLSLKHYALAYQRLSAVASFRLQQSSSRTFIQQSKDNYADIGKLSLLGNWKIPPHKSFIVVKIPVCINKWEF